MEGGNVFLWIISLISPTFVWSRRAIGLGAVIAAGPRAKPGSATTLNVNHRLVAKLRSNRQPCPPRPPHPASWREPGQGLAKAWPSLDLGPPPYGQ